MRNSSSSAGAAGGDGSEPNRRLRDGRYGTAPGMVVFVADEDVPAFTLNAGPQAAQSPELFVSTVVVLADPQGQVRMALDPGPRGVELRSATSGQLRHAVVADAVAQDGGRNVGVSPIWRRPILLR